MKWSSPKCVMCHLFLFQKTLMLCRTNDNISEPNNPHLVYEGHIRYVRESSVSFVAIDWSLSKIIFFLAANKTDFFSMFLFHVIIVG